MTSTRIAIAERVWDLFNRVDPDPDVRNADPVTEELLDLFDPEIVFSQPAVLPDTSTYHGRAELRDGWNDWFAFWAEHRAEIVEITERGDRVLVLNRNHLVGREGLPLDVDLCSILTFRGDRIVRFENVLGLDEARAAFDADD